MSEFYNRLGQSQESQQAEVAAEFQQATLGTLRVCLLSCGPKVGQTSALAVYRDEILSFEEVPGKPAVRQLLSFAKEFPLYEEESIPVTPNGSFVEARFFDCSGCEQVDEHEGEDPSTKPSLLPVRIRPDPRRQPVLFTAHCVALTVSVDRAEDVERARSHWVPILRGFKTNVPYVLLGLRTDIRETHMRTKESLGGAAASIGIDKGRAGVFGEILTRSGGMKLAEEIGALAYLECSAYDFDSVAQVMEKLVATAQEFWQAEAERKRKRLAAHELDDERLAELRNTLGMRLPSRVDEPTGLYGLDHRHTLDDAACLEADNRALDDEDIRRGLCCLGKTDTGRHAYLKLSLENQGLTSLQALRKYEHLRTLILCGNQLRNLHDVVQLPNLTHLDASRNQLMGPGLGTHGKMRRLETCDLSYNRIRDVGDWTFHEWLRELNLRGNLISTISEGLVTNDRLVALDLSENTLTRIENLNNLPVEELHMAGNELRSIEGLESLDRLSCLNVASNSIKSLEPLSADRHPRLRVLNVSDNGLSHASQVECLAGFARLCDLYIAPSAMEHVPFYRTQILYRLPQLRWLDFSPVHAEEKVEAAVAYGADVEEKREIWMDTVGHPESFVDRRKVTEQVIKQLEASVATGCAPAVPQPTYPL